MYQKRVKEEKLLSLLEKEIQSLSFIEQEDKMLLPKLINEYNNHKEFSDLNSMISIKVSNSTEEVEETAPSTWFQFFITVICLSSLELEQVVIMLNSVLFGLQEPAVPKIRVKFVDPMGPASIRDNVDSVLAIDNLAETVWSNAVSRIVDENVVSLIASSQDPVSAIVNIADHNLSWIQIVLDLTVSNLSCVNINLPVKMRPFSLIEAQTNRSVAT